MTAKRVFLFSYYYYNYELSLNGEERQLINLFDSEMIYIQDYEMKKAQKWNQNLNDSLSL